MIEILNPDDLQIIEFTRTRDRVLHDKNLVVCESEKLFLQFIHNKGTILKTLSTKEFALRHNLNGENNFVASKNILESVSGFKVEYDVLFLVEKPKDITLSNLGDKIILLNGLTSPENVGSIVRSCAAFKINSLIADEKTCSPFLRRSIRVSMGNVFSMKINHAKNIREDLVFLKSHGYKIITTANISRAVDLKTFDFSSKIVLIIGSEGHGVDQDIIELSDHVLKIIIDPQVAHLNAANAASIFLYQMSNLK